MLGEQVFARGSLLIETAQNSKSGERTEVVAWYEGAFKGRLGRG